MNGARPIAVVTGGAGFIGSHMVDALIGHGYRVRVVDNLSGGRMANLAHHASNPDLSFEEADIRDLAPEAGLFRGANYVLHFAGIGDIVPSIERPTQYMDTNVQGTVRVLEAARHARIAKFVYAASSSCYGLAATPTREDHPIAPQYPYALSKYLGEQAAFHWHRVYRLPVNSVRIFNAYGTRVRTTGAYGAVFGVFFKQKLAGKPFTVVGDGDQIRQVFWNLARNAVQAMPNGGTLRVTAEPDTDSYRIRFIDTGRGMSDADQRRLFQPFRTNFPSGTGLGMAISYRIVQEHGGDIDVASSEGVGTMITVSLPVRHTVYAERSEASRVAPRRAEPVAK